MLCNTNNHKYCYKKRFHLSYVKNCTAYCISSQFNYNFDVELLKRDGYL